MFDIKPATTGSASPLQTATQGLQRGIARAATAAQQVAGSAADPGDLAEAAVEMRKARAEVAANARVLRTADDMLGTLIDLRA